MKEKDHQLLTVRLTLEDHRKLKAVSDHEGVSIAGLVRQYVRKKYKRINK